MPSAKSRLVLRWVVTLSNHAAEAKNQPSAGLSRHSHLQVLTSMPAKHGTIESASLARSRKYLMTCQRPWPVKLRCPAPAVNAEGILMKFAITAYLRKYAFGTRWPSYRWRNEETARAWRRCYWRSPEWVRCSDWGENEHACHSSRQSGRGPKPRRRM